MNKHLALSEGTPFCVFLSPTAGMRAMRGNDGKTKFIDYTEDDGTRFHYTWCTTEKYRKSFGHLDFQYGESVQQIRGCGHFYHAGSYV